jgi:hypothetical protein
MGVYDVGKVVGVGWQVILEMDRLCRGKIDREGQYDYLLDGIDTLVDRIIRVS